MHIRNRKKQTISRADKRSRFVAQAKKRSGSLPSVNLVVVLVVSSVVIAGGAFGLIRSFSSSPGSSLRILPGHGHITVSAELAGLCAEVIQSLD